MRNTIYTPNTAYFPAKGVSLALSDYTKILERNGLFQMWMEGAFLADIGQDEGMMAEALLALATMRGYSLVHLPVKNLIVFFRESSHIQPFVERIAYLYGVKLPIENAKTFAQSTEVAQKLDVIMGNLTAEAHPFPPKVDYFETNLPGAQHKVSVWMEKLGKKKAKGCFFVPLSMFLDVHSDHFGYTSFQTPDLQLKEIVDCTDEVNVACGWATWESPSKMRFPIPYIQKNGRKWNQGFACPLTSDSGPFFLHTELPEWMQIDLFQMLRLPSHCKPHTGVFTGSADNVFFFDRYKKLKNGMVRVGNALQQNIELSEDCLKPLWVKKNHKEKTPKPYKWVLTPYNDRFEGMTWAEIEKIPLLHQYLDSHKRQLMNRWERGGWQLRGIAHWWTLGNLYPRDFCTDKIIWDKMFPSQKRLLQTDIPWLTDANTTISMAFVSQHLAQAVFHQLHSLQDVPSVNVSSEGAKVLSLF